MEKFVHRETVVVSSEQLLPDCQGKDVIATRTASLDSELRPSLRRFLAISMLSAPDLYAHDSAFIIDVFGLFSSTRHVSEQMLSPNASLFTSTGPSSSGQGVPATHQWLRVRVRYDRFYSTY